MSEIDDMRGDAILTMEGRFGHADLRRHAAKNVSSTGDRTMPSEGVVLDVKVEARVNHGRWIADCPNAECGGAELASFATPFLFCCECRNRAVGGAPISVTVPGPGKRREIEAYLRARPDAHTRNWYPHETVSDLRDENRARGITLIPNLPNLTEKG